MQGDNFEFDKIILSVACGIVILIISINVGDIMYHPKSSIQRGYEIPVSEGVDVNVSSNQLPEVIDIKQIMLKADAKHGEFVFNKCAVCHNNYKGAPNKVGPNLWGIIGKNIASSPSFSYSPAMQAKHNMVWSEEVLYRYLYAPKKYIPGTKMAFMGIKDDKDRVDLIAYLKTLK